MTLRSINVASYSIQNTLNATIKRMNPCAGDVTIIDVPSSEWQADPNHSLHFPVKKMTLLALINDTTGDRDGMEIEDSSISVSDRQMLEALNITNDMILKGRQRYRKLQLLAHMCTNGKWKRFLGKPTNSEFYTFVYTINLN